MECEDERGSAEIKEMFCEVCKKRGKYRSADGFCVDCVRYFCAECLANHTEFLPDHIEQDKKQMPQDVCLQQCPGHTEEIIKFYCTGCGKFFCQLCKKKDHNDCKDVGHLPNLVNQLEQGKEFKDFKHDLEGLVGEISNIESIIESDKESIETNSRNALLKIESARQRFIKWLDAQVKRVQTITDKDKKAIEEDTTKLCVVKEQVSRMKSYVEQMQIEQKKCQLFMAMKDAQIKQRRFFDDLQTLRQRSVNKFEFEQLEEGQTITENVLQFGRLVSKRSTVFPDVDVQTDFIAQQLNRPLIKGDLWYVLDVKWFNQWKSYVGYDCSDHSNVGEESAHPGPIDNTPIFQKGTEKLKVHLIEDLDYALIPEEGWRKLQSWYGMLGGQKPLPRCVIEEGLYTKSLKVEVYRWHLKLCENSNLDKQIVKSFSRSDTIGQLEQIMREEFNIAPETEVRLWNRYMTNVFEQLCRKDETLQGGGLYQGQVIVIEKKDCYGLWPRDT